MSTRHFQVSSGKFTRHSRWALSVILCIMVAPVAIFSQDLIFSQYYNAPLHNNSAFAGTVAYPNFTASYRLQWPGITKTYETYALTYDQYFKKKNLGIGFIAFQDDQGEGTLNLTRLKAITAYNLQLTREWRMKLGVGVAYVQNRLDWDKLVFFDQIDPQYGQVDRFGTPNVSSEIRPDNLTNGFADIDIGLLFYNPDYYVGLSMFHINGPYDGFLTTGDDPSSNSLPVLLSIHAGYQIVIEKDNKGNPSTFISPNLIFATQSGFQQVTVGSYFHKDVVFGGLWLRHTLKNLDALIVSAGVKFNNFKVAYSFDMTSSTLGLSSSGGSHEISIAMGLKHLEKKESKMNDCFSLFR